MATVAIMVGGAVLNAATFIGGNYLAKYLSGDSGQAALDEKKRTTSLLRNIRGTTPSTKRIAHNSSTGLHNKIGKRIKPSTTFKIQTKPWRFITKLTAQRLRCQKNPSSRTTTNPAHSRRMASCSSLVPAPWPLGIPPFDSCEHTSIHEREANEDLLQSLGVLERYGSHQKTS